MKSFTNTYFEIDIKSGEVIFEGEEVESHKDVDSVIKDVKKRHPKARAYNKCSQAVLMKWRDSNMKYESHYMTDE